MQRGARAIGRTGTRNRPYPQAQHDRTNAEGDSAGDRETIYILCEPDRQHCRPGSHRHASQGRSNDTKGAIARISWLMERQRPPIDSGFLVHVNQLDVLGAWGSFHRKSQRDVANGKGDCTRRSLTEDFGGFEKFVASSPLVVGDWRRMHVDLLHGYRAIDDIDDELPLPRRC